MSRIYRWRFVILGVVGLGLVVGTIVLRSGGGQRPAPSSTPGALGPTPGPNSDGYVRAKRSYLERLATSDPDTPAAALVSFSEALSASEVSRLVRGMSVSAAFVDLPASQPEAVHVETTVENAVTKRAGEIADITRREIEAMEKSGGAGGMLAQRKAELAKTTPNCACVYAAVVGGTTVRALAALQASDAVRVVDVPRPAAADLAGWRLTPILPRAAA